MSGLRQVGVVSLIGLGSLRARWASALVIVTGMGCVVGVLTSMLAVTVGLTSAYLQPEDMTRALVWAKNGNFEQSRGLHRNDIDTILSAPGIARRSDGAPLADPEYVLRIPGLGRFGTGSLQVRGIGDAGLALRPAFRIVQGKMFSPGSRGLVAGIGAARKLGLSAGSMVRLRDGEWPIVGLFSCGSDILEGYLVGDAVTLMAARRAAGYAQVIVQLVDLEAYPEFQRWLTENSSISVSVEHKADYDLRMAGENTTFFSRMALMIGGIMVLGAIFGVVKIMYGAVRARTQEIGTLRALGFGGGVVGASVLIETALLGVLGALIGLTISWLTLDGRDIWVWGAFKLRVTPFLWTLGVLWALVASFLGGVLPALRAGRLSPVEALRAE
jgi:putative ABC transport system permease protein